MHAPITVLHCRPAGLELSAVINGYRVHQRYLGYTVKEAVALFTAKYLSK